MTRSHVRFLMLALISAGTLINYLDRAVLGVAAPLLTKDLRLTYSDLGIVFSAFSWGYVAAQIPGGILLDRFGTRVIYFVSVTLWSVCTLLQGAIVSVASLLACRLGLGIAEAPCYPANSRVLGIWFPQRERARGNAVFALGQYVGLAFLSPLLFWLTNRWGWRALFYLAGASGLIFAGAWLAIYRDPSQSARVNQAELNYIEAGGGVGQNVTKSHFSWRSVCLLVSKRQFIGAAAGQFASNSTLIFFLTWFPTYLSTERHMQLPTIGTTAVLPYVAASAGVLTGGWLSDWLLKVSASATIARKAPVVAGLLMATTIVAANYVHTDAAVVAIMSFVFFGQGMCNLGFTLITDVAPKHLIGLTAGLFNLCANLAGIITPVVIGFIVGSTGSFVGALMFISVLALTGVVAYVFILGPVRRIEASQVLEAAQV